MRGGLSEAASIYFADVTLASAFVARWCVGSRVETTNGMFQVREDEPAPRVGARPHSIPSGQRRCRPTHAHYVKEPNRRASVGW